MKKTLLSILILLCLLGCKKDNKEIVAPITQPVCYLTKFLANGMYYYFQYDAKNNLSNYIDPFKPPMKFIYDANNRVTKINYYYDNDESNVVATEQIEYNAKGQWAKLSYAEKGNLNKSERTYAYDANGNRTKTSYFKDGKLEWSYFYEYTNGNLTKVSFGTSSANQTGSYLLEYDTTKENKLAKFEDTMRVHFPNFGFGNNGTPSKNMIKKINIQGADGSVEFYASYTYEYDDKGYPTKIMAFTEDANLDGHKNDPTTYTYDYTYQCK